MVVVDKPVEVERVVQVPVVVEKKVRCQHMESILRLLSRLVWSMCSCQAEPAWIFVCLPLVLTSCLVSIPLHLPPTYHACLKTRQVPVEKIVEKHVEVPVEVVKEVPIVKERIVEVDTKQTTATPVVVPVAPVAAAKPVVGAAAVKPVVGVAAVKPVVATKPAVAGVKTGTHHSSSSHSSTHKEDMSLLDKVKAKLPGSH